MMQMISLTLMQMRFLDVDTGACSKCLILHLHADACCCQRVPGLATKLIGLKNICKQEVADFAL